MEKKTVLMVHNFYQIGGGEHTVFRNEVDLLRENGHRVIEYTRSNDELKESKIKMLLLPITTIWSFKTYFEVKRIIREQQIEIVHCHNTFPLISPSVYYAARSLNVPVIQTVHNFRFLCPNGLFYCDGNICEQCCKKGNFIDAIKYKCYRDSRIQTLVVIAMLRFHRMIGTYRKISYIFLTEFNKTKFAKLVDVDSDQVYIKPNFVDKGKNINDRNIYGKKFVFASRLDENKGIKQLLENWENLPKDFELVVFGDGPLKELVIEKAGTNSNIKYFGFQKQETIFKELSTSVALMFPSICYEGFPMIIAESMSIGCPVVCPDLGNHGDIVKISNGGVVYENGKESFEAALDDIIENNAFYSSKCLDYYNDVLSKEMNYKKVVEIYDKARVIK